MSKESDLNAPFRGRVVVSINPRGRVTFINPPPPLALSLAEANHRVSVVGKANQHDYYLEVPRDEQALESIIRTIKNRLEPR